MFIDSHAHLTDSRFVGDLSDVLRRASERGVRRILTVAVDATSARDVLGLAQDYASVTPAIGLHPSESDRFHAEQPELKTLIESNPVCAVGEIGLDFGRYPVSLETQLHAFRTQVGWAVSRDLPVIVHNRDASEDVLSVLEHFRPRGVLHCFSGDAILAERALNLDMYVSFAGNVTYKSAGNIQQAAREVPLERILIETDSPYLPPQKMRGTRNEPANVVEVAAFLAELKGTTVERIEQASTENALCLFGLGQDGSPS